MTARDSALPVILLLCIVRLWIMPLSSSLWVDEMATVFVVHFGPHHPSLKIAPQVADSIYYFLPWISEKLLGPSEVSYRLSSVVCMGAALIVIARIAARLIHREAAWFVVFASLTLRGIDDQAGDARPYALATLIASAGVLFAIRWLDSGRLRDALGFICAAALLWRVHLILWPFYLVLTTYVVVRVARRDTPVGPREAMLTLLAIAVSLIPVLPRAIALLREAQAHVIVASPSFHDLLSALKITLVGGVCAAGIILALCSRWPRENRGVASRSALVLILSWWLIPPLSLFAFSRITGDSVFVSRYLYLALPGAALAATASIAPFIPRDKWKILSAALGAGFLIIAGQWRYLVPPHHNSDWRAAVAAIDRIVTGPNTPLICPSPFIEARPPVWTPEYQLPGFLYSHLFAYPVRGTVYPFPYETSPEAEAFAIALAGRTLGPSGRFIIYGQNRNVLFWRAWFSARPELTGWQSRRLGPFRDVEVVVFDAPSGSPRNTPQSDFGERHAGTAGMVMVADAQIE